MNETLNLEGAPCPICNVSTLRQGLHVSTFEKDGAVVVIKQVPGWVCDSCGESYDNEGTAERVLHLARSAFERGAEVEVLRYSPAPAAAA